MGKEIDWGVYTVTQDEETKEFVVRESFTGDECRHADVDRIAFWIEKHLATATEEAG